MSRPNVQPGDRIPLRVRSNGFRHTVTVVRIGKRRITCRIDSDGRNVPYEFTTFNSERAYAAEGFNP